MKKLIAMIGAVAMSFGLFADVETPATFAISYEANETAAGVSEGAWEPGTKWSWNGEVIPVITDDARVLPYGAEGTSKARRENVFLTVTGGSDNHNYADLSTGTDELTLTVDSGNVFLDQLVKFTGFEDPQTNLIAGTKIAIWMSEFENEDESTSTNLYITCGKNVDGTYEQVALQIEGTYELNTWYRLTVKSLGDIFNASAGSTARAGFLVWVNGNKAICEDAKTLLGTDAAMITDSKKTAFYNAGRLFPAFSASATLATVGYQGIGAIDDIIVDANGPLFCVETIDVSFNEIENATIASVVDSDGIVTPVGSVYSVKPGTLTVTLAAAEGYKLFGQSVYEVNATVAGAITIDTDGKTTFEEVVATLIPAEGDADELAQSELAAALAALEEGDKIETVAGCGTDDYNFSPNTTITGTADGLVILIGNVEEDAGSLEIYSGVAADFALAVAFEEDYEGTIMFAGDVEGTFVAANGTVEVTDNITLGAAATFKAATIDLDSDGTTISIVEGSKVMETTGALTDEQILVPDDYELDVSDEDAEGYYTYTAVEPAADYAASIEGKGGFDTLADAFAAAEDDDVIVLLKDVELDACIDVAKAVTLDIGDYSITPKADALDANKKFVNGTTKDALFVLHYGADFTVNGDNGVIDTEGNLYAAIKLTEAGDQYVDTTAKLTVNANLTGTYYAITGSGNAGRGGTEIVINGGLIKGTAENDCAGIYHPQAGTLTITGGTIEGATGIYAKAGDCECTVSSGATIKGVGAKAAYQPCTDGFHPTGDAIVFDNCNYPGGEPEADIAGGTFESTYAAAVASYATAGEEAIAGFVTGGSFKGQVAPDPALAGGSMAFPTFVPGEAQTLVPAVASVNDVNYKTAAEALAAVQALEAAKDFPIVATALADAGLTIVNPETEATITIAKDDTVTIDENSWTFSGSITITGQIGLAAGAAFTVVDQIANYKTVFTAPADCEVTETKNDDDTYTYSAAQSAADVAQIGGTKFKTLGAAIAALTGAGETIELLSDYTAADDENLVFTKDATLDLGEFELTLSAALQNNKLFKVADGASVSFENGTITMGDSAYGLQVHGTATVSCTMTKNIQTTSGPIFDIYGLGEESTNGGTVYVVNGADLQSDCDIFRHKKKAAKASVIISGGTMTATAIGDCNHQGIFYAVYPSGDDVITITGGKFIGKFDNASEKWGNGNIKFGAEASAALFDGTAKLRMANYLADGYELVESTTETGFWQIAKIPSFDVTFTVDEEEIPDSATNVLRDTTLTADMIPDVSSLEGAWDVDPVGAIITETTNFNFTTVKYVTITLPQDLPDGVTALVVSQKVDDVWIEVDDNQIVVGNDWKVEATVADGYTVDNPIKSGTAELGVDITVDASDFTGKIHPPAVKVVEIVGGDQYETLGEAIAALTGGETIKLLANYTTTENLAFNKTCTLDLNEKTLTIPADYRGKPIAASASSTAYTGVDAGATLTVTNGSVVLAEKIAGGKGNYGFYVVGKLINYANWTHDNTGGPVIDLYEGAEVVQNDGVLYSGDIFRSKDGVQAEAIRTVTINGGTMTATGNPAYSYPIIYFTKSGTHNITINGGTFETAVYGYGVVGDTTNISGLDGDCQAKFKNTVITVSGAKTDLSAYVAPGYELVKGDDDYYTIAKIPSFDVTFTKNTTEELGSTNVLRGTALTADMIPTVEGGTWDVDPVGAVITCNTNFNYTVKAGPDWPSDWPADVPPAMKEAFQTWATTYGVSTFEGAENAFLMNDDPKTGTATALEITSIEVADGVATIKVAAGEKNLETGINGKLFVSATDDLAGEWKTIVVEEPDSFENEGKTAVFEVEGAQFMKAKVDFKVEEVEKQ